MFRVRTRPECPEDNQRELTCDSNLNCGIAREREKINLPEHTAGCLQNKGSKQVQRRARRLQTGLAPPAGGRGEGKGAGSAPRTASPTSLQTSLQFLIKDLLRFWMGDIRREGCRETQGARTQPAQAETEAGAVEGRRRTAPWEECARQAPGCLRCLGHGRHKTQVLLWNTRGLEPQAAQGPLHIEQPGA